MKFLTVSMLVLLLIFILGCTPIINTACDDPSYNFIKLYDIQKYNLIDGLNLMINDHTKVLKDCSTTKYSKYTNPIYKTLFDKYSIASYEVSYSCDILNFSSIIYEREKKLYILSMGFAPCDNQDHVYFDDERIFNNFEDNVIETNRDNFEFCVNYNKKINKDHRSVEDDCLSIQAVKTYKTTGNADKAIDFCNKIKWIPTKAKCYERVVSYLWHNNPKKAKAICNQLNNSVPKADPFKYMVEFCYQD